MIGKVGYGGRKFYIFQARRDPSFFIRGSGSIKADYDRIEIDNPSSGEIVIKYHWLETLKTEPKVEMEPVMMRDDPIPFIKLNNPGYDRITISN